VSVAHRSERIWVLDTELNGEHPGEIIELAAVEMVGLVLTGRYRQWRFRPILPVTHHATRVHGITNRDLARCARFAEHEDEIRTILSDHAIAGHAVHVEVDALRRVMPDWTPVRAYDTLRMSRKAHPDLERHRLSAMGDHLGLSAMAARLSGGKAHSAFYDALLCGLILRHIVDPLDDVEGPLMLRHAEIMRIRRENAAREAARAARKALRRTLRTPRD
jgi:DNA polymerase-3 subunit epsilon